MKQLLLIFLLSTVLFSAQKEIVLGCYLEHKYAVDELAKLNKRLVTDKNLIKVVEVNSLEAKLTSSEGYNVLVLAPFNNKNQMFLSVHLLKKYYKDLYVLDYPSATKKVKPTPVKVLKKQAVIEKEEIVSDDIESLFAEVPEQISAQAKVEVKEKPVKEIKLAEKAKVVTTPNKVESKKVEPKQSKPAPITITKVEVKEKPVKEIKLAEKAKVVTTPNKVESKKVEPKQSKPAPITITEDSDDEDYYTEYMLALFALLVLIGIGYLIKREIKI